MPIEHASICSGTETTRCQYTLFVQIQNQTLVLFAKKKIELFLLNFIFANFSQIGNLEDKICSF